MILKRESHRPDAGIITALCVVIFRMAGDVFGGGAVFYALMREAPGGVF